MEASFSCKLILYADDSALLVSGKHIQTLENVLGDNLLSLSHWLKDNKLSLHLGKKWNEMNRALGHHCAG